MLGIITAALTVLVALASRFVPANQRLTVLLLPKIPRVDPRFAGIEHVGSKALDATASADEIKGSIDGMRSIMETELLSLPIAGVYAHVCCDCGMAHRFTYGPAATDANELVLSWSATVDHELGAKLRATYPFDYRKPIRRLGLGVAMGNVEIGGNVCRLR